MRAHSLRRITGILIAYLLAACGSVATEPGRVETNYDKSFDFSEVKSIYIQPFNRTDAATITVSDGQIRRINAAITNELEGKGFSIVPASGSADLLLSWYLVTEDRVRAAPGSCPGCDRPADSDSQRYAKGTLSVDLYDPIRGLPVWRSTLRTQLTAEPGSERAERARREAAAAMFANFPPA